MYKHQSSEQLMGLACQGDKQAFTGLVKRHSQSFFRVALSLLHNEQEAEDVVQDAFLKIWNKPKLWDPSRGAKFTTWFYKIVFYGCLDKIRKNSRVPARSTAAEPTIDPKQEQQIDLKKRMDILKNAMEKLNDKENKAVFLCLIQQLSHAEAAEEMETGVRSLQGILMRAKTRLRSNFLDICNKRKGKNYGRSV
ncbi:MAG: sigma-70 family RNA polymerase sigma factor [Oligoflexales bacterium]|nr:sigma-70 family RNA polymerase sigma factor [Oligoflexales bacterium]